MIDLALVLGIFGGIALFLIDTYLCNRNGCIKKKMTQEERDNIQSRAFESLHKKDTE